MLISFSIFQLLQRDAFEDKLQLVAGDLHTGRVKVKSRYFEGAFFQAAVKDCKAALLIDQQLEVSARLIDKNKGIAISDPATKLIKHDAAKQIKAFAHISLFAVQMIAAVISQCDQAAHDTNSLR